MSTNDHRRAQDARPLEGLRVVDLGSFWAAPYMTAYLGAMGADVVKVESIQRPDGFRFSATFPELGDDWHERSLLWQGTNLNKRGVTLNLGSEDGRDVLRQLCSQGDVFIENYAARVVEQFGFDHESLLELNPRMIVLRLPGFGIEGPWRDHVGWGNAFEQLAGLCWVTGFPDGPPLNPGGYIDPTVGMHATTALLAALEHRERTGEGQLIEVPQIEVGACVAAEQVIAHSLTGTVQERQGNRSREFAPQGVYPCSGGDDDWVAITVRDDAEWAELRAALDEVGIDMTDPHELDTLEGRRRRHDELDRVIETWTSQRTAADAAGVLRSRGVVAQPVLKVSEHYEEPNLVARGYYQEIEHPLAGTHQFPGFPMQFWFQESGPHVSPAPTLGQHNSDVLAELGLTEAEVTELENSDVIGTRPLGIDA